MSRKRGWLKETNRETCLIFALSTVLQRYSLEWGWHNRVRFFYSLYLSIVVSFFLLSPCVFLFGKNCVTSQSLSSLQFTVATYLICHTRKPALTCFQYHHSFPLCTVYYVKWIFHWFTFHKSLHKECFKPGTKPTHAGKTLDKHFHGNLTNLKRHCYTLGSWVVFKVGTC